MEDSIFDDLEKLFEECDDVTESFYKSAGQDDTTADEANCGDSQCSTGVRSQEDKSELPDSDAEEHSVKLGWEILQTDHSIIGCSPADYETSREEGECSRTQEESKNGQPISGEVLKLKQRNQEEIECSYSSFIDSSKEEGECSTTSFEEDDLETTIKAVSPEQASGKCSESNKENDQLFLLKNQKKIIQKGISVCHIGEKRKRSVSDKDESTPKRRHLFVTEDILSPISYCILDKQRNTLETAETPIIESKFSLPADDICSSTPVTTEQKFLFPTSDQCSTPVTSTNAGKQGKLARKEILKTDILSNSDSEFQEFSDVEEITDEHQTVDELIAEITKLCEDSNESLQTDNDEVLEKSDKILSKIEVNDLINEWKTVSSLETASENTEGNNDKTLTENIDVGTLSEGTDNTDSDIENLTVLSAVGVFKKDQVGNESDESSTDDRGGRFKAEVTVSRIEGEKCNETNREAVDICDGHEEELQYGDDLLNLNDYDDEGFVDENVLENSHLTKDLTVKSKEAREDNSKDTNIEKGKKIEGNVHSLFNLVQSLQKKVEHTEIDKKTDICMKGLDYAAFDTSIYRKKDNTAIEREICWRWDTDGSADPDINLTVATTKRNKCRELGRKAEAGFLEGDKVSCTYLYEEEIMSTFEHYGKTEGQSDLCYMPLENLIRKLYNQKKILENMNKQSLLNMKHELEWQLKGTKVRHCEEMAALRHRQSLEDEHFRFNTRSHYNVMEFQNNLMQLRQEHIFQEGKLREHHQYEYNAVRSHGMKILNEEVSRHGVQCEPINELIAQLQKPEAHALSSPQKYGPPIVVSLRKGPCRTSGGKHSTVAVCLSAGIAQAVSLEDDLYDHYYSY